MPTSTPALTAPRSVARAATELQKHWLRLTGIGLLFGASVLLSLILAVALIRVFVGLPLLILLVLGGMVLAAVALAAVFLAIGSQI